MTVSNYRWLTLREIAPYEPDMARLGVSEVARSPRGFLTAYKRAGGDWRKLSARWLVERENFIKRHFAQYKVYRTYRQFLALVAWAYKPYLEPTK